MSRALLLALVGVGTLVLVVGAALLSGLSGLQATVGGLADGLDRLPQTVESKVTMDPEQTKVKRYKYNEAGQVILEAEFCWDGTAEDRDRIAREWVILCEMI